MKMDFNNKKINTSNINIVSLKLNTMYVRVILIKFYITDLKDTKCLFLF